MQNCFLHSKGSRRVQLTTATLALEESDNGKHVAVTIPHGEIVEVAPNQDDGNTMVEINWNNRILLMFKIDLANRGQEID